MNNIGLVYDNPVIDEDGNIIAIVVKPITSSHEFMIDIIGIIPECEGYHINLRVIDNNFDISLFEPYIIEVNNPVRGWM